MLSIKCTSRFTCNLLILLAVIAGCSAQNDSRQYRICIPQKQLGSCEQMQKDGNPNSHKIKCVPANDKIDCIEKIVKDEADFLPLEPEEIYVAHRFKKDAFSIITEIRSAEFQNRDYRYEPVAVVRKSSGINSISDLQGKKSCHTGFGRNAGWKIPFSHLMDKNELPKLCDGIKAPTPERDLYAISNYFQSTCAPGSWVSEKFKDQELKEKYPNLCELCDNPLTCAKDDKYGGYEGALKCLTMKGADIAWTKMDSVEAFFKLREPSPTPNVADFAFLCWDGSSVPLTSVDPCSWAKRPWRAILASTRLTTDAIEDLQNQIAHLHAIATESAKVNNIIPTWLKSVLEFDISKVNQQIDVQFNYPGHTAKRLSPSIYLNFKKNYTVTIEKPSCATKTIIKMCVRSEFEKLKCTALGMGAMGRRILPSFQCILGESALDCIQKVSTGEADVVNLDPKDADWARKNYKLVSILSEMEEIDLQKGGEGAPYRFALAIIRTDASSGYRNISDLRGKRSCHGSVKNLAGWNVPMGKLRDLGEITGPTCGLSIEMIKYFGNKTCVPGALDVNLRMPWIPQAACSLCAGDGLGPGKPLTPETLCVSDESERYYGDTGALRCLEDKVADVAFTDHVGLHSRALGSDLQLKAEDLRLLCPTGKIMEISHFQHCNWGKVPSRKIVTRGGEDNLVEREDARLTLLKVSDTFGPGLPTESVFRLFGPYFSTKDLLFSDTSVGLCDEALALSADDNNGKLISDFDYCTNSQAYMITRSNFYLYFALIITYLSTSWM